LGNCRIYEDTTYVFLLLQTPNLSPANEKPKKKKKKEYLNHDQSEAQRPTKKNCEELLCSKGNYTTNTKSNQIVRFAPPLATTRPAYITFKLKSESNQDHENANP
jgi:hypothetical protein